MTETLPCGSLVAMPGASMVPDHISIDKLLLYECTVLYIIPFCNYTAMSGLLYSQQCMITLYYAQTTDYLQ